MALRVTKTIYFHDSLKEKFPEPIKVEARSVYEALTALQLRDEFNPKKVEERYPCRVEGFDSMDALKDETLVQEIHLYPVVLNASGDNGSWIQIIIGIILIVVAWYLPTTWGYVASVLYATGFSMVLGGVIQLLTPQPKMDGAGSAEDRSKYLGSRGNTVAIGTPIPIVLGRRKVWGHYLSFNVDAGDINGAPDEWYSSVFTDFGEDIHSAVPELNPLPDPGEVDGQSSAVFTGYSPSTGYLNFSPARTLSYGGWVLNFTTGLIVPVITEVGGLVNRVKLDGFDPSELPSTGTSFIFSKAL